MEHLHLKSALAKNCAEQIIVEFQSLALFAVDFVVADGAEKIQRPHMTFSRQSKRSLSFLRGEIGEICLFSDAELKNNLTIRNRGNGDFLKT